MIDPIDVFLGGSPPSIQAISQILRQMVRDSMPPDAHEVLYAKQNHIGYSLTGKQRDRVLYICPMRNYARLGFMDGANLPDPEQVLTGSGKRIRHVKVYSTEDDEFLALNSLITAAWERALAVRKKKSPS